MSKKSEATTRLRDLPNDELKDALDRARDEYFHMRLGNYTNQLKNPLVLRAKRREVARIMTVMHARKLDTASTAGQEA
ncbi:MAG: 50S ribosomal protein L29 [Myxococcales bacterium]|nr:50S ribosomal protein L29 [Myxococcales bacterium]